MDKLLDELGWSRKDFALRIGVHKNTLSNWNKNKVPKVVMIYLRLVIAVRKVAQ